MIIRNNEKYNSVKVEGKIYYYKIYEKEDGSKSIMYLGIVTYPEYLKLKEKLSKKYKWYK